MIKVLIGVITTYLRTIMKFFLSFFILLNSALSLHAQIDSRNKSFAIPAIESNKKIEATPKLEPIQTDIKPNNSNFGSLNLPNLQTGVEAPKKTFSLFSEKFGNPGELYTKQLDKIQEELKPEGHGDNAGLKEDAYWGDYKTKSDYLEISYRDYSAIDGDLLRVLVDDDIIKSNEGLTGSFTGFRLKLKPGLNKIDFYAINEGASGPNTAEYRLMDQWNKIISNRVWALSKGVKVTVIVVKE